MPSGPRPTSRPGAGPGRGKPRGRTSARERDVPAVDPANEPTVAFETRPQRTAPAADPAKGAKAAAAKSPAKDVPAGAASATEAKGAKASATKGPAPVAGSSRTVPAALQRVVRANLTARALALVVVVLVLTISYATSLRIYFSQAHEIASTKAQIADSQTAISDLQGQISRWNDPAYVAAQARERLGWLVPGETGYTVVGADGKPLGGGLTLDSSQTTGPEQQQMWWDRMWGSVAAADRPAVKKADPAKRTPITPDSKPR